MICPGTQTAMQSGGAGQGKPVDWLTPEASRRFRLLKGVTDDA